MAYTLEDFRENDKTKYTSYPAYEDLLKKEEEANSLLSDQDMREIAEEELKNIAETSTQLDSTKTESTASE